jgi:hypothetical protein
MAKRSITHNPLANRYELYVEGELASVADYRTSGEFRVFDHTETATAYRGRGLAAELVRFALDDVRARGLQAVPLCWFVARFIDEHPEYSDLVTDDRRRAAG